MLVWFSKDSVSTTNWKFLKLWGQRPSQRHKLRIWFVVWWKISVQHVPSTEKQREIATFEIFRRKLEETIDNIFLIFCLYSNGAPCKSVIAYLTNIIAELIQDGICFQMMFSLRFPSSFLTLTIWEFKRGRQFKKTMIRLVEWGKIIVLHV